MRAVPIRVLRIGARLCAAVPYPFSRGTGSVAAIHAATVKPAARSRVTRYKAAAAVAGKARSRIAVTATTASALSGPDCTR